MPYIVPSPGPAPRTGFGDFTEKFTPYIDMLMQAMLSGQMGQTPTQGSYTSSSGMGTKISPAEVSAQNPNVSLSSMLSQNRPQGSSFSPAGMWWGIQPDLTRQVQQMQLQKGAYEMNPKSPENRYKTAQAQSLTPEFQGNVLRMALGQLPSDTSRGSSGGQGDMTTRAHQLFQSANDTSNPNAEKDRQRLLMIMNLLEAQ